MKEMLNNKIIQAIKPADRDVIVWDEKQAGLCLKVTPQNKRTWFCYYRTPEGQQRKPALGSWPDMTVAEARVEAEKYRVSARQGDDISAKRQAARKIMTLRTFWQDFYRPHAEKHTKPKTFTENERRWRLHIEPAIGSRRIDHITVADVRSIHQKMSENPVGANRVISLIRAMLNQAREWEYLPEMQANPAMRIKPYPESKGCERFLDDAEYGRLAAALDKAEHEQTEPLYALDAIRLLAFTGCRRDEILDLKWEHVDLDRKLLNLPDAKAGKRSVQLNNAAVAVLNQLLELHKAAVKAGRQNDYVIKGHCIDGRLVGIHRIWERIRTAAKLEGVRLHDLRHSYASAAVGSGLSLYVAGGLLGHRQHRTSQRYAHLAEKVMQDAAEKVGQTIIEAMSGKVVEITPPINEAVIDAAKGGKK